MDRDRNGDGDRGAIDRVRSLLALLAELERTGERRRDGRADVGGTSVDFSMRVGTLDDLVGGDRRPEPGDGRGEEPGGDGAGPEREAHVDVRETDAGAVVVADLPRVDGGAVDATIDEAAGALRIAVGGETVGTVPLSGEELSVADATVTNRVLEVRLERTDPDHDH